MAKTRVVPLPAHVQSAFPQIEAPFDSCFVPRGFLFPESRSELAPFREFPLSEPFYVMPQQRDRSVDDIFGETPNSETDSAFDSTILQITELDELLLDVQGLGIQYSLHSQMCLRDDLTYTFPKTWDQGQALWCNIPVFTEEFCLWHYPISTVGYNVANTDPPLDLDIAHNSPKLVGFLPNGDLAVYWEIAMALAQVFRLDLDPMRTTVDGTLVLLPGVSDQIKRQAPCDMSCETGLIVRPNRDATPAISFAWQWAGIAPVVLKHAIYPYFRLRLPVIHCELDFNPYGEATWGAFGFTSARLTGFEFKIVNNPFTRDVPIFSTERGNIVVSRTFYDHLAQLCQQFGMPLESKLFPIQRIP